MKIKLNPEIKNALLDLINCGDGLTDAAETCGHDEELKDWKKSKSMIKKLIDLSINEEDKSFKQQLKEQRIAKEKKKEEDFLAKRKLEDAKFLEDMFGMKQGEDGVFQDI